MEHFFTNNLEYLKALNECNKSRMPSAEYIYLKIGGNEEICFHYWDEIFIRLNTEYDNEINDDKYYISFYVGNRASKYEFFRLYILNYEISTEFINPFIDTCDYFIPIDTIIGTCLIDEQKSFFEITLIESSYYNCIFKKNDSSFKGVPLRDFYGKTKLKFEPREQFDKKYEYVYKYLKSSYSWIYKDSHYKSKSILSTHVLDNPDYLHYFDAYNDNEDDE